MVFFPGAKVTHIFRPEYGIGTIHLVFKDNCTVSWNNDIGTSMEPYSNLRALEQ